MSKTALVVATISGFIKAFEMNDIHILQQMGYTVHVATNIIEEHIGFFQQNGIIVHRIDFERSPFNKRNFSAINQIRRIIEKHNISLVHCHTPVGGVIARLAAKKYRRKGCKIIYSVHGLQFYQGAPKKDWIIYYPVEKILSRCCDAIITINHEDYSLVSWRFHSRRVYYIPGIGINLDKFGDVQIDRIAKRATLGLGKDSIMLLSVGEINDNKNQQIIIDALSKIENNNLYYMLAGVGPLQEKLQQKILEKGLERRIFLLGNRTDVNELLKATDIFVHSSKREGLSVALMEALASGLPVVCSRIRGNNDLIDDGQGGILCDVNDEGAYVQALTKLSENSELRRKMAEYNQKKIQNFSINVVDKKMRYIYRSIINN